MKMANKMDGLAKMMIVPLLLLVAMPALFGTEYSRQDLSEQSAACLDCHENYQATLHGSPHAVSSAKAVVGVNCISCHDGWAVHMDDPSGENISGIIEENAAGQAEVCSRCHLTPHQTAMLGSDPHARAGLACTSCHKIHNNPDPKLYLHPGEQYCIGCHPQTAAEFQLRSAHPLHSENIQCRDCHDLSGIKNEMTAGGLDWTCQNCHSEVSGPFIHEHPVVNKHLVNGGGCLECHRPHGSVNDRLLSQPGGGTCMQCHGIPPGHMTAHSGFVAQTACVVCHTDIHGSNTNDKFLDPNLGSKFVSNCFGSGCHSQND